MTPNTDETPVLVGYEGQLEGQRWFLQNDLVLGRDMECDISIPNRQVSRKHAQFSIASEGITLEDLNSKNGTHCNGRPVIEPVLLVDGDVIQIALAQKFVYLSADATLPLDLDESAPSTGEVLGRLRLDKRSRRVWIAENEVLPPLSVSQFRLLEILYRHNGLVVPRQELVNAVWGEEDATGVTEQAIDALVRRLRDRLAAHL